MSKSLEGVYNPIVTNKELVEKLMSPLADIFDSNQLFDLDPKDLNPILDKYAVDLLKASADKFHFMSNLFRSLENKKIMLSEKMIEDLVSVGHDTHVEILKFTSPLITQIAQPQELHPIVQALLAKTHTLSNLRGFENKTELAKALSDKLNYVINSSSSLTKILEQAAKGPGDIVITNQFNKDKDGYYIAATGHHIVISNTYDISYIVSTIVHESTHKVINAHYNNESYPYRDGDIDSFAPIIEAITLEMSRIKRLYSDLAWNNNLSSMPPASWLDVMLGKYPPKEYDIEIFAWFTQNIVLNLLKACGDNVPGNVSIEFGQTMWEYFQKILVIPIRLNDGEIAPVAEGPPEDLGIVLPLIPEANELALRAHALIDSGPISIEWFANEAWKLAVKGSHLFVQEKFINDLFVLEPGQLELFLEVHAANLLVNIQTDCRNTFITKLFALDPVLLESILNNNGIELLKAAGDTNLHYAFITKLFNHTSTLFQKSFITKLFSSPDEIVQSIFNKSAIELFEAEGLDQTIFINKLFTLKESVLRPILEKHGVTYLSMMAETKPELVEQVYATHNMLLKTIFTDWLGKAWIEQDAVEKVAIVHHLSNCALKFIFQPLMTKEMLQLLATSEPPHENKEPYEHKHDCDDVAIAGAEEADHVL